MSKKKNFIINSIYTNNYIAEGDGKVHVRKDGVLILLKNVFFIDKQKNFQSELMDGAKWNERATELYY